MRDRVGKLSIARGLGRWAATAPRGCGKLVERHLCGADRVCGNAYQSAFDPRWSIGHAEAVLLACARLPGTTASCFHLATSNQIEAHSRKLRPLADTCKPREPILLTNAFSTSLGLFLGIAIVWWVRPDTNAGTVFIVVASTVFCFILGVVLTFVGKLFAKGRSRSPGGSDEII